MLTQNSGKKTARRIFLDVIAVLLIITCLLIILSFFGFSIGITFIGTVLWLIFFINVFRFAKLTKKYTYIVLFFIFLLGIVINLVAFKISLDELAQGEELVNVVQGNLPTINHSTGYYVYAYLGAILNLLSLTSMIIFYFRNYRKYLTGEKTLYELGVREARNEEQFTHEWQEKEDQQNKIGWVVIAILIVILAGIILYIQFG